MVVRCCASVLFVNRVRVLLKRQRLLPHHLPWRADPPGDDLNLPTHRILPLLAHPDPNPIAGIMRHMPGLSINKLLDQVVGVVVGDLNAIVEAFGSLVEGDLAIVEGVG